MGQFENRLKHLTTNAIVETQVVVADAFDRRFGSPANKIVAELRAYASGLRTWTVNDEAMSARPLLDLLEDAAQAIAIRVASANRGISRTSHEDQ